MNKAMIAPIVAFLAMAVQMIFGVTIPEEAQEQIVYFIGNGVALGLILYGLFKDPQKKDKASE